LITTGVTPVAAVVTRTCVAGPASVVASRAPPSVGEPLDDPLDEAPLEEPLLEEAPDELPAPEEPCPPDELPLTEASVPLPAGFESSPEHANMANEMARGDVKRRNARTRMVEASAVGRVL
jgi:hypothetical protein